MSDWGKVPREVFLDDRLTRRDLRVFGTICGHADGRTGICRVKQATLAEEIGSDRVGVLRSIKKLIECGYLAAHQPAGMRRSLQYRVLITEVTGGQLNLFGAGEAPRQAATKPARRGGRKATSEQSDVALEATSAVASDATPKEQTLQNRSCAAAPAAPANDDRPAEVIEEAGAVPLRRPPQPSAEPAAQVPSWTRAQTDALGVRLRDAAGSSINSASPGFLVLAEPIGWLAAGCDLELDVLPAVAGLAARSRGSLIRSWSYFAGAVREARDRRIEAAKPARAGSPDDPRSTARGGEHAQRSRGPSSHRTGSRRRNHADELDAAFDDAFAALLGPVDAG